MSAIDSLLAQLDQPDHTHVWSRDDVLNARAELSALRARLAAMEEALREISGPSQDCFECSSQHIARAALAAKEDRHGAR